MGDLFKEIILFGHVRDTLTQIHLLGVLKKTALLCSTLPSCFLYQKTDMQLEG